MQGLKKIASLLLGAIFLLSASGFNLYKSHCSCSGKEYTSIIIKPATCETEFHNHHKHDNLNNEIACSGNECHECHSCDGHADSCGCDSPESFFIKLKDKAIDEEVKFVSTQPIELEIASTSLFEKLISIDNQPENQKFYSDPPPLITSSFDFLIEIHRLKIPSLA
ncbi:hypothetical protein [uncultured Draconibacterium sp.]|uniref:hypothetical protein n=1 Tax=uncultured Draconibacterium sp. TaxID=1573823 RepID=UPI0025D9466E|nr:hypothetical protein [uncultured Draconibacterium sp.]